MSTTTATAAASNILQQKNMNNSNLETTLVAPPQLSSLSSLSSSSSSVDSTNTNNNDKKCELTSFSRITKEYNEYKFDVCISNVVCSYSTQCHLNLKRIASDGINVEYKRENGMANMKIRKPNTTASIWSSGKITCTGAKSELEAKKAARRYCRVLQKIGFRVKFCNYRVVNVLSTLNLPFELDIVKIANKYPKECSYEPELHPGATYKIKELKATLKLFTTGSVTLTTPSVGVISNAIDKIYPILYEFRKIKQQQPQPQITSQPQVTIPIINNNNHNNNNNVIIVNNNNNYNSSNCSISTSISSSSSTSCNINNNNNNHYTTPIITPTPTIILSESSNNTNNNNFIYNNNNNNNSNNLTATTTTTTTTANINSHHNINNNNNNNNNNNLNNTDDINNYLNAFDDYPSYNHTYMTNNDNLHHHNYNKHKQFCVYDEDELFS